MNAHGSPYAAIDTVLGVVVVAGIVIAAAFAYGSALPFVASWLQGG